MNTPVWGVKKIQPQNNYFLVLPLQTELEGFMTLVPYWIKPFMPHLETSHFS